MTVLRSRHATSAAGDQPPVPRLPGLPYLPGSLVGVELVWLAVPPAAAGVVHRVEGREVRVESAAPRPGPTVDSFADSVLAGPAW